MNTKNITDYNDGKYVLEEEMVELEDDKTYFIMLNLRTIRGLLFKEYEERFGEDFFETHQKTIAELEKEKLIKVTKDGIAPTYEGMMILDQIIMRFIEE